jgi:hypothetical protein
MAKITIRKSNGETLEISDIQLTMQEIRELAGINGNGHVPPSEPVSQSPKQIAPVRIHDETPDYAAFKKALSENGRKFVEVLRQYPNGIVADDFAMKIGLKDAVQIGGITGGGLSKLANRCNVELSNIYTVEKKFENGVRRTTYTPGRDIAKVQ